jgi:nicotinamidase
LYICGLAGDYCCKETAIDAALYGYRSIFIKDATRFIGEEDETMKELAEAGVEIVETWNLPLIRCS